MYAVNPDDSPPNRNFYWFETVSRMVQQQCQRGSYLPIPLCPVESGTRVGKFDLQGLIQLRDSVIDSVL